ncbi:MAG TPA: DUF2520 domain-containing protein [Acidobacteriota bacterium]|nr:DUF2520 domain-containing protein [Acidobacteriota bacterium]HQF86547.1 DUF2520 domain-containing protein [Acidobacteriota bacterium]HQG90201.1 DUF2520 domain-containing protein [Acidobacteriota bacterium]
MTGSARSPDVPLLIVGAGRVGLSLAAAARRAGMPAEVVGPGSRRRTVTVRGRRLTVHAAGIRFACLRPVLLVLAVPDDDLSAVASEWAAQLPADCTGIALHTSGVHAARVLEPLQHRGWPTASWHPLQTFPQPDPARFSGIVVSVEGDPAAVSAGSRLARRLGARPIKLPPALKALYHCLATISCSHVAAQMLFCHDALRAFPPAVRKPLAHSLRALSAATVAGFPAENPAAGITGPAARGDRLTVAHHLTVLREYFPEWVSVYQQLDDFLRRQTRHD